MCLGRSASSTGGGGLGGTTTRFLGDWFFRVHRHDPVRGEEVRSAAESGRVEIQELFSSQKDDVGERIGKVNMPSCGK